MMTLFSQEILVVSFALFSSVSNISLKKYLDRVVINLPTTDPNPNFTRRKILEVLYFAVNFNMNKREAPLVSKCYIKIHV